MVEVVTEVSRFTDREAALLVDALNHAFTICYEDYDDDEIDLFRELIDALDRSDGIEIVED